MISDIKKSLIQAASSIDYEHLSNTSIAKKYLDCVSKNDSLSNAYYAALIVKSWGTIPKLRSSLFSYPMITIEDCYDCLIDGVNYVLKYKDWDDKNSMLYNSDDAFDRMLIVTVSHLRCQMIKKLYYNKNKVNINKKSLDDLNEKLDFEPPSKDNDFQDIYNIVESFLDKGQYINAIIIDKICFSDVFTENRNKNRCFNISKLYEQLKSLDSRYYNYFKNTYGFEGAENLSETIKDITNKNQANFETYIRNRIKEIKESGIIR